jgi:methyltransferase
VTASIVAIAALATVLLLMLGELRLSRRNERRLLAQGAIAPADPVYRIMRWAYPGVFIAMALEGALAGREPGIAALAGAALLVLAKTLKFWAIGALGRRWSYRVLVLPGVPLVRSGPYALMRHPNYVAVVGELAGMALLTGARVAGPAGALLFVWLVYRRIQAEEAALGLSVR